VAIKQPFSLLINLIDIYRLQMDGDFMRKIDRNYTYPRDRRYLVEFASNGTIARLIPVKKSGKVGRKRTSEQLSRNQKKAA
jgi:hypothetical protein